MMMRGKRSRREKLKEKKALLDELDLKWMISIWTISFSINGCRESKIYISIYQHLFGSIHHHIDRTEVWDKRILIVVSTKVICYQIMKLTSRREKKKLPKNTHHSIIPMCVCVCWTEVYSGVIIQWPLFKLDSVVMPIKRIQLLLLLFLQRNLWFFLFIQFRDRVSSFDELPILSLIDLN